MPMMRAANQNEIILAGDQGVPFIVRAEYVGKNGKNASGRSSKFWLVEREYPGGPIQIRYGRIGTHGTTTNVGISAHFAFMKMEQKERKGYRIVSRVVLRGVDLLANHLKAHPTLRPLSEWAEKMPAPFNTIVEITKQGMAYAADRKFVCKLPDEELARIGGIYEIGA